jgi:RNA polymerase sigma-54 factor
MNDPRLNLGLQTKLVQKLLITPQMKQSLSLLQMNITDLVQEIDMYIENNPTLEVVDHDTIPDDFDDTPDGDSSDDRSLLDDLSTPEWDDYIADSDHNELSFTPLSEDEMSDYEQYVAVEDTLEESLLFQLKTAGLTPLQIEIGREIIGNLDDDGYFRDGVDEIAESNEVDPEAVYEVLDIIKTFDPIGIACATLAECILMQLPSVGASEGEIEQISELFENYSSELTSFRYDDIERKSGLDRENLTDLLDLIRKTDPRPGASFNSRGNSNITPDVYIVRNGEEFDVLMNESGIPPVRLNTYYLKALKNTELDGKTKEYIEEKVKNALWVLKSIQKRQKAIYKVTKSIVDVQREFLLKGESYLKPLRLKDVADMTELHESTISRVTAGKYALCEQGLLELKSFFSKGMDSDDGDVSTRRIRTLIREIVDGESAESPYSDEKIVGMLSEQGVEIARRTVAKYRDELNIPTMSKRKRMRR